MARGTPDQRKRAISSLIEAIQTMCDSRGISSAHVTFPAKTEWKMMGEAGFLQRTGIQVHYEYISLSSFSRRNRVEDDGGGMLFIAHRHPGAL